MEVLKYLISDEAQTALAKMGKMPVVNTTNRTVWNNLGKETADWSKNLNWSVLQKAKMMPLPATGVFERSINSVYVKYANQVMLGELDMNTAFRKAEEEALQTIEKLKGGYTAGVAY